MEHLDPKLKDDALDHAHLHYLSPLSCPDQAYLWEYVVLNLLLQINTWMKYYWEDRSWRQPYSNYKFIWWKFTNMAMVRHFRNRSWHYKDLCNQVQRQGLSSQLRWSDWAFLPFHRCYWPRKERIRRQLIRQNLRRRHGKWHIEGWVWTNFSNARNIEPYFLSKWELILQLKLKLWKLHWSTTIAHFARHSDVTHLKNVIL